ncbi:MAG: WD40/YVTN/BNR-like repeat-containing protein, partial [bacterium]
SWQLQNSGSDRSLRRVTFVDTLHGWVVESGGGIISTSDGGLTWQPQNTIENFASISVYFLNREYGWAVGGLDILLETRDGGATWEKRYERDPGVFLGVFFLDENIGWIVGAAVSIIEDNFDDGLILHTEDGGQTWQEQLQPVGRHFKKGIKNDT